MTSVVETIRTPWSLRDAYAFLEDFERIAEWDPTVRRCQRLFGETGAAGTQYTVEVEFGGRISTMTYTVVSARSPTALVFRGLSATHEAVDTITFSQEARSTLVTWRLELYGRGALRLFDTLTAPLLRRPLAKLATDAMTGLARAMDGEREPK